MNETAIRNLLVERGKLRFNAPRAQIQLAKHAPADALLNDLERLPHAFVLGCVMDRRIKAEKAWLIPFCFAEKMGTFEMPTLATLSLDDVKRLMQEPEPLHILVERMSAYFHAAVQRIVNQYNSDAAAIWRDKPSSATVVYRFLEFAGVGQKIATMAANILARDFKIEFSDYYSVDVSVDVHIRRVFARLGLTPAGATVEQIVDRARALHPEFPGLMDLPAWQIGRTWCMPSNPDCAACFMNGACPKVGTKE